MKLNQLKLFNRTKNKQIRRLHFLVKLMIRQKLLQYLMQNPLQRASLKIPRVIQHQITLLPFRILIVIHHKIFLTKHKGNRQETKLQIC